MRFRKFEEFHHQEVAKLSAIRFRFAEKKRPDDYATWISEHMAWPMPTELLLAAPRLTWDWQSDADKQAGEAKVMEYLDQFRIENSRAVLMAPQSDHTRLQPDLIWGKEPWYGTEYAVKRFSDDLVNEASLRFIQQLQKANTPIG